MQQDTETVTLISSPVFPFPDPSLLAWQGDGATGGFFPRPSLFLGSSEIATGDAGNGKGQGFETQGSTSVVSQIRIEPITVV